MYIIFIVVALLACSLGAVGAYFYYRARHREAVAQLEALDQDLAEREEELHRLQYQFTNARPGGPGTAQTEIQVEMQKLGEELEQKRNDYNILKQDFDLEIGILKQELDQLREEKSGVEQTRRHLTRKDAELEERENDLQAKEQHVNERSDHLEAEIEERTKRLEVDFAARTRHLEEEINARGKGMENAWADRERQLRAREIAADEERDALERRKTELREKQSKLDADVFDLPVDKFTSRQEAILIKRLRQQIKLQRDELELLQRLYHGAAAEAKTHGGSDVGAPGRPGEEELAGAAAGPGEKMAATEAEARNGSDHFGPDQGDSFPAYSTLSSYVDPVGEAASRPKSFDAASRDILGAPARYDDLTSLPGINEHLQGTLYELGIKSFDQIARWSSADVRRISEALDVDRKTIQDHWIISAQSHLFARRTD